MIFVFVLCALSRLASEIANGISAPSAMQCWLWFLFLILILILLRIQAAVSVADSTSESKSDSYSDPDCSAAGVSCPCLGFLLSIFSSLSALFISRWSCCFPYNFICLYGYILSLFSLAE